MSISAIKKRIELSSESSSDEELKRPRKQNLPEKDSKIIQDISTLAYLADYSYSQSEIDLIEKIAAKIIKKTPEATFNCEELKKELYLALPEFRALQEEDTFPSFCKVSFLSLIATDKEKGYIIINHLRDRGANKKFYKGVRVEGNKVKGCAENLIVNPEKFQAKGYRIDPLDFSSPHVIAKSEFIGENDGQLICIRPLYDGDIFNEAINKNWTFEEKLEVMTQAAMGIEEIHEHGYVHRDITLKNIFVKTVYNKISGETEKKVVIADDDSAFKISDAQDNSRALHYHLYTPGYISLPESFNPSPAADMHAFGICLKHMLREISGKSPEMLSQKEKLLNNLIGVLTQENPKGRFSARQTAALLKAIQKMPSLR